MQAFLRRLPPLLIFQQLVQLVIILRAYFFEIVADHYGGLGLS